MSKKEKLLARLLQRPKDFTYDEMKGLLSSLGYEEFNIGKASGSRVAFINKISGHPIRLHKPHPKNILKSYQIELIIEELKKENLI